MAVGVVGLLLGAKACQKEPLQPEKLSLLLRVEELQVGVVDHVQTPAVLSGLLVADDDLLAKLVKGILKVRFVRFVRGGRGFKVAFKVACRK